MGSGCRLLALSALKITLTLFLLCCPQHAPQFAFRRFLLLSLFVSFSLPVYLFPCLVLPPSLSHTRRDPDPTGELGCIPENTHAVLCSILTRQLNQR